VKSKQQPCKVKSKQQQKQGKEQMQDNNKKKRSGKTKKHTLTRPESFLGASNVKKTKKIVHPKSNLKMK
jgi:hypothetical protein